MAFDYYYSPGESILVSRINILNLESQQVHSPGELYCVYGNQYQYTLLMIP